MKKRLVGDCKSVKSPSPSPLPLCPADTSDGRQDHAPAPDHLQQPAGGAAAHAGRPAGERAATDDHQGVAESVTCLGEAQRRDFYWPGVATLHSVRP